MKTVGQFFLTLQFLLLINALAFAGNAIEIKGRVLDKDGGEPLEYASASLFRMPDEVFTAGAVTDIKGDFVIEAVEGVYRLDIQYVGYIKKEISITIDSDDKEKQLGKIYLTQDSEILDEVEVVAERSTMTMTLDKRVFNVGKDVSSTAGNAIEVLENIPSVSVDVEGNVSLRGDDGVQILVDGKVSALVGTSTQDALRSLQADMIERIEVVTNPSVRYDAEGTAGIINIVLKKDKRKGINGSIDVRGGIPFQWGKKMPEPFPFNAGVGASVNYRLKRFNIFANYNFNYRDEISDGYTKTEYFRDGITYNPDLLNHDDAAQVSEQITERGRNMKGHTIRGGLDYYLTDNDILSFSAMYRQGEGHNTPVVTYIDKFQDPNIADKFSTRAEDWHNTRPMTEMTFDYDKYFITKDNYLKASFRYSQNTEREWSEITENQYLTEEDMNNGIFIADSTIYQYTDTKETNRNLQGSIDFAYHIGLHSIEAGAKYTNRLPTNTAIVKENNEFLTPYCHEFNFNQQVAALYASYGTEIGLFSFLAGARYEYTYTMASYIDKDYKHTQNYHNIFPSGHINFKLTEEYQLQMSYTRRIRRPGYRQMAPYSSFNDDRNFRVGNPELRPVFTDSYEFSYLKFWERGNFNLTGYYRHSTDIIRNFTEVVDDISTSMPWNFGISDDYGLEAVASLKIFKWWDLNGNINLFKSCTTGDYKGTHYTTESYNLIGRLVTKFNIKKVCNMQITGHFMGPHDEPLGFRKANYWLDLAASRDVLNGKGTLTLNVRDVLGTRSQAGESWGTNFWQYSEGSWSKTTLTLNFNYRINDNGQKRNKQNNFNENSSESEDDTYLE
ncbi:MAG: TonB-dependent receptor domain-containing protein [Candidatus Limimorpha sp.]